MVRLNSIYPYIIINGSKSGYSSSIINIYTFGIFPNFLYQKQPKKKSINALNQKKLDKTRERDIIEETFIQHGDLYLLKNVSDEHIELLEEDQIYSIEQLRKKITTQQDANTFSEKLGIYKSLVDDWVRLGEFSRLHGITQVYIDLLEKNGVKTVRDLQNQDPIILYDKFRNMTDNTDPLPTMGMIKRWIRVSKVHEEIRQIIIVE